MKWLGICFCVLVLSSVLCAYLLLHDGCGACLATSTWLPISVSCDECAGWRPSGDVPASEVVDVRVTKALGTKGYDQVRVSVIQRNSAAPLSKEVEAVFRDQLGAVVSPFRIRWTHSSYYTRIMSTSDTHALPSSLRPSPIPAQGAGVTGFLFGDPCSQNAWEPCGHAQRFQTHNTSPALLNLFMDKQDLDFYALLGDNLYDQTGEITAPFWNALTAKSKSKVLMTVPGNHDFWVLGSPASRVLWRKRSDQFGYGMAQWHMMDTVSAKESLNHTEFNARDMFEYSVDPDASPWPVYAVNDPIAHPSNFFWYNQLGDVVFVGYSGAHDWKTQQGYFLEACHFLQTVRHSTNWVILMGHWDSEVLDLTWTGGKMDTPVGYWMMSTNSCSVLKDYYTRGRLKFTSGHTHCNIPNPHRHPRGANGFSLVNNATGYDGFLLGGMGRQIAPRQSAEIATTTGALYWQPLQEEEQMATGSSLSSSRLEKSALQGLCSSTRLSRNV